MTTHRRDDGRHWQPPSAAGARRTHRGWMPRWALLLAVRAADARIARIERELAQDFGTLDMRAQLDQIDALLARRETLLRRLQRPGD